MVYASWEDSFDLLTTEEQAQFLKNLFLFNKGEEPILNTSGLKMLWTTIKFNLEKDQQSYLNKVEGAKKTTKIREARRNDEDGIVQEELPPLVDTTMSLKETTVSYDVVPIATMSYDKDKDKDNVKDEDIGKDNIINNIRLKGFDNTWDNI